MTALFGEVSVSGQLKLVAPSINLWCCRLGKLPHISITRLGIYFDEVLNAD